MNSLLVNEDLISDVECLYIEKEVDMGFFDNFTEGGQLLQSGCPCKCTCDCNRCALPFG